MRTHVLESTIKAIFAERCRHGIEFEVKATEENDKEYQIIFRDEVYIPYGVFRYLDTIGWFGVKFTESSVSIHFNPTIPDYPGDENYEKKIGEYFDKLYPSGTPNLFPWHFTEQEPIPGYNVLIWKMSKGADYWVYKPSDILIKEYENIRQQLEFITQRTWKIVVTEKPGDKDMIRHDFIEIVDPREFL